MNIAVIIPAAGLSTRFGAANKVEQDLAGRAVFVRSVELFTKRSEVEQIIVAVDPDGVDEFKFKWGDKLGFHGVKVIAGGKAERWETVLKSLDAIDDSVTHVAVHDAARPMASAKLVDRLFELAQAKDAVIPALPVANTLKRVADVGDDEKPADPLADILGDATSSGDTLQRVVETVDRRGLVEVQTPQVFKRDLLVRAYEQIASGSVDSAAITDDAGLVEALGEPVYTTPGEVTNFKITRPDDLHLARAIFGGFNKDEKRASAKRKLFADDDWD